MKLHPEVLVPAQKVVLTGSASITQKWGAYLAGGSGLALQIGHRRSRDFDWFTRKTVPPVELLKDVKSLGLPVEVRQNDEGTFLGAVAGLDYSVSAIRTSRHSFTLIPGMPTGASSCMPAKRATR